MEFLVLGSGDAFGSGGRHQTSFLLTYDDGKRVLVDCGASTLTQLKKHKIELSSIQLICISHVHGDHFGGLPYLLLSAIYENPEVDVQIIGPASLEERVLKVMEELYPGSTTYVEKLKVSFLTHNFERVINLDEILVSSLPVSHSELSDPHAISIVYKGKVFAYSGDSSWDENLVRISEGADLFVIECSYLEPVDFGHMSLREISRNHLKFNCKELYLTHMSQEVIDADSSWNKLEDDLMLTI